MTTLTIDTKDEQVLKAVKALLRGFDISFEEKEDFPYDPEFVAKIERSRQEVREGKTSKIALDEIWK